MFEGNKAKAYFGAAVTALTVACATQGQTEPAAPPHAIPSAALAPKTDFIVRSEETPVLPHTARAKGLGINSDGIDYRSSFQPKRNSFSVYIDSGNRGNSINPRYKPENNNRIEYSTTVNGQPVSVVGNGTRGFGAMLGVRILVP